MLVHHTAVGFLIVESTTDVMARHRGTGPYWGVDRLPPFIAPDPVIRQDLNLPLVQDPHLAQALDEYFDKHWAGGVFFTTHNETLSLLLRLKDQEYSLEIIFCELAWTEQEKSRLDAYNRTVELPACSSLRCLGYDVSWPGANHSAIFEPGVVNKSKSWQQRLNEWGLLDRYSDAATLREEYLQVYPYPPFDIFRVYQNGRSSDGQA